MPYIKQERRHKVVVSNGTGFDVRTRDMINIGELNFAITTIINDYLESSKLSYAAINEVIGVLECAKLELYRRVASPYEDKKIKENGDVYTV